MCKYVLYFFIHYKTVFSYTLSWVKINSHWLTFEWLLRSELYMCAAVFRRSAVSPSLWPRGLQPARRLRPWDSPGKSTGAGCHSFLQGIFPTQGSNPGLPHYHLSTRGSPMEPFIQLSIFKGIMPILLMRNCGLELQAAFLRSHRASGRAEFIF